MKVSTLFFLTIILSLFALPDVSLAQTNYAGTCVGANAASKEACRAHITSICEGPMGSTSPGMVANCDSDNPNSWYAQVDRDTRWDPPPPAAATPPAATPPAAGGGSPAAGRSVAGDAFKITLTNPLQFGGRAVTSFEGFILAVLSVLIVILTPLVALAIIFAGFQYVTAGGNPTKIQNASRALMYAIIGAVLVIGAITLSDVIQGTIGQFRKGS